MTAASVIPFPLAHEQPLRILGRDDAVVLYQRELLVGVVFINHDGSAHSAEVPIDRVQLAFGKRVGAGPSAKPAAPRPREEDGFDAEMEKLSAFFGEGEKPCA